MKNRRLPVGVLWVLLAVFVFVFPAYATEETEVSEQAPVQIYTAEDLQAMAEDPAGSYILMNDIDMTGIAWKSLDFSGSFDGNGHAILNLTLSEPGDETPNSYDGNSKAYETSYIGFFGTLQNAGIRGLKLINVRAVVESDVPCFLGGIAGYMNDSTLTGCTVTGFLELRAHDRMFGVGGLVGYGAGSIENCKADVTLITTDTDQTTRDEQFLGGILATGFADIKNCEVVIDGYCSEYGYCHNGGMVGMLMRYPLGDWTCTIADNSVTGKITFFECNTDRRAYCDAYVGEYMTSYRTTSGNTGDFLRDERFEYEVELRPETCEEPVYIETVVPAGCDTYGYTSYTCESCEYTYTDHYTPFQHIPGEWTLVKEPTVEEEGMSVAYCPCGQEFQQTEEKLEPPPTTEPPTEAPAEPPETVPAPQPESPQKGNILIPVTMAVVLILALIFLLRKKNRVGKYSRK